MGFRFRRSLKLAPGLRLNFSKRGTSLSVGGRGMTANISKRGVRQTVGVPGTGMSYSHMVGKPHHMGHQRQAGDAGMPALSSAMMPVQRQPSLLLSAVYFIFIGSWLSLVWALVAWTLNLTVVLLPVGLKMLDGLPKVATLREPQSGQFLTLQDGVLQMISIAQPQRSFRQRAIYFILVGWWLSLLWIVTAWALELTIIGIPLTFWMLNRVPAMTTLRRY